MLYTHNSIRKWKNPKQIRQKMQRIKWAYGRGARAKLLQCNSNSRLFANLTHFKLDSWIYYNFETAKQS